MDLDSVFWVPGYVCGCEVIDDDLREFVARTGYARRCENGCGMVAQAVPRSQLFKRMYECIVLDYTPYSESSEVPGPEWEIEPNSYDSDYLLYELGEPLEPALKEVFVSQFGEDWVPHEVWTGPRVDSLLYSWEQFCEVVKHKVRFVFRGELGRFDSYGPGPSSVYDILETVCEELHHCGTVVPLGSASVLRARKHSSGDVLRTARELGPPPTERTVALRMSPAGFSYFYGATDVMTCLAEVRQNSDEVSTVGQWLVVRDVSIVDLVRLPEKTGYFDLENRRRRRALEFVERFAQEISRPIDNSDEQGVDYVPTQIVAEFLRHTLRDATNEPIMGIRYPSSLTGGENIVLFIDSTACADDGAESDHTLLTLIGTSAYQLGADGQWTVIVNAQ